MGTTPSGDRFVPSDRRAIAGIGLAIVAALAACTTISTRLAMNEGVGFYKAKEYEKAAEKFKEAIQINPTYADAYLDLGLTYMELYEPGSEHAKDKEYADGAIKAFMRYIELNPANEKGQEYLINVCNLAHRLPDVIDFFMKDYEKNPRDLKLVKKMAALYRMAGDTEKSIEWYEKAAELEPENPEAWYSVGVACWARSYNTPYMEYDVRMQLLDKAVSSLERAIRSKPDYFEAYSYLSLSFRQKAQYDISPAQGVAWRQRADETLQKAMELRNKAMAAQAAQSAGGDAGSRPATSAPSGGQ